jgi:hypothetical protein
LGKAAALPCQNWDYSARARDLTFTSQPWQKGQKAIVLCFLRLFAANLVPYFVA